MLSKAVTQRDERRSGKKKNGEEPECMF